MVAAIASAPRRGHSEDLSSATGLGAACLFYVPPGVQELLLVVLRNGSRGDFQVDAHQRLRFRPAGGAAKASGGLPEWPEGHWERFRPGVSYSRGCVIDDKRAGGGWSGSRVDCRYMSLAAQWR